MGSIKLGLRMALAFGLVLALSTLTLGLAMWRLQSSAATTQTMLDEPLAKERMMSDWYRMVYTGVRRVTAVVAIARTLPPPRGAPRTRADAQAVGAPTPAPGKCEKAEQRSDAPNQRR